MLPSLGICARNLRAAVSAGRTAESSPRKRGRPSKTYAAVLGATTRLLETTPLSELSVAQILAAAKVGRTSFYEHFSSKDDVVVKLVRGITAEVAEGFEPMLDRRDRPVEDAFREGLGNWLAISVRYRPLLLAAIEEWPAVPALRRAWFQIIGGMTAQLTRLIDADRAAGLAPPGAPSEALAASLAWGAERAFHITMSGGENALGDENLLLEPLVQLFVGTIYGRPVAAPSPARSDRP
jgi:AcrR family transcriptional regulator